jgi:hypothetical protein
MSIPSQKEIIVPLLHLIHSLGGEAKPPLVYDILAKYFALTEKERQQLQPSGVNIMFENRVAWVRNMLCDQGFLDRSIRGIWKITEKGRRELSRLGLIDKPFPNSKSYQDQSITTTTKGIKELKSDDEEILDLILDEIAPDGPKRFPDDFLDNNCSDFYELDLPGIQLRLAPLSETIITSPKGYFRYQAKNPPEAKYILYAHKVGSKKVKIPKDNLTLFKAVKAYEKYCYDVMKESFELFIEFTNDEEKAESLTDIIANRLDLRAKRT